MMLRPERKTSLKWEALVALAAGLVGCAGESPEFTNAWRAALADSARAALSSYVGLVNTQQWDSVAQFYADDSRFHLVENGRVAYTSQIEVAEALRGLESSFSDVQLEMRDTRIEVVAPGVAHVTGLYHQTFGDSTGIVFSIEGAVTFVLTATDEGWRILVGHTSQPSLEGNEAGR